ncbi:HTTM domain-containing protein [Bailinhaonella thermotolerans]|uniref:HTTM domain-containing protein n=1 Tax=Bailinhaonella thermotolerans TaxID=1070861 RepID=UPI00192A63B5|nr:HTTM domain-containing protein [Bailinhaonella thermotolerans]
MSASNPASAAAPGGRGNPVVRWFFSPVPAARVAVFRIAAYLFIPIDVLLLHALGSDHASATALYKPLVVAELLHLPRPTPVLIEAVKWSLLALAVAAAALAASGRWQRVLGTAIFVLYFEWTVIAFSFGKVDHDRIAFLVALAVLPTVAAARLRDRTPLEAGGWALRCVQIAVVATYFLAAFAKIRFGGIEWVNSATLVRAVMRRHTIFSEWTLSVPWVLHLSQWGIMIMELASPVVLFLRGRRRIQAVLLLAGFHVMVFATITIMFWPHVLCLLLAFLPTERLVRPRPGEDAADAVRLAPAGPGALVGGQGAGGGPAG